MNSFFVGVPYTDCPEGLVTTREDEAVGIAVGAWLVGQKPIVYMQNSGLGNCIDIITSLLKPYGIEIPLIISNRSTPEHHAFMGKITKDLLRLIEYESVVLH